jgi:protein TonB
MADQPTRRRYLSRFGGAVIALLLIVGFVWFVRTMMSAKSTNQERMIQTVQIIRPPPPPPPPDEPPPPPPEKTEEPLPKDQPEPEPDNTPPPAEPMGLDAQGTAGDDAFGLAARHGGSDLIGGTGNAMFAWYTNKLKDAVLDKLSADPRLRGKKYSLSVQYWIEPDGRIKQIKLVTSTGNRDLDEGIENDLKTLQGLGESRPLELPQPVTLKIVTRN